MSFTEYDFKIMASRTAIKQHYLNRCFAILAIAATRRRKNRMESRERTRVAVEDGFQES